MQIRTNTRGKSRPRFRLTSQAHELRALDNSSVWLAFQKQGFKKEDADNLLKETFRINNVPQNDPSAEKLYRSPTYWTDPPVAGYSARSLAVYQFFQKNAEFNRITPYDAPSDELLIGPAAYEKKGAASDGLQKFQQQLKAAQP